MEGSIERGRRTSLELTDGPRSSVDRALPYEGRSRAFESRRGRSSSQLGSNETTRSNPRTSPSNSAGNMNTRIPASSAPASTM